jgi:hypothetical protein
VAAGDPLLQHADVFDDAEGFVDLGAKFDEHELRGRVNQWARR